MQEAIPYNRGRSTWTSIDLTPLSSSSSLSSSLCDGLSSWSLPSLCDGLEGIRVLVAESPVLVVGRRGCCMCHVVKQLLLGLGVNPAICEVGDEIDDRALIRELKEIETGLQQQKIMFPAVFIGGRLVGGLDRLMAAHISGDLVPILKEAGALWL